MAELAKLTEEQWRWIESHHSNRYWRRIKITVGYTAALAAIVYTMFYVEGTQYAWTRNITFAASIGLFCYLLVISLLGLVMMVAAVAMKPPYDAHEAKMLKMYLPLIHRDTIAKFWDRYNNLLEYSMIITLIAGGWPIWGSILFAFNLLVEFMLAFCVSATRKKIAELSPEELAQISSCKDNYIANEILAKLKEMVKVKNVELETQKGKTTATVYLADAPQSRLVLELDQGSAKLAELHYSKMIEHRTVDLSQPNSIEDLESVAAEIAQQRVLEATG